MFICQSLGNNKYKTKITKTIHLLYIIDKLLLFLEKFTLWYCICNVDKYGTGKRILGKSNERKSRGRSLGGRGYLEVLNDTKFLRQRLQKWKGWTSHFLLLTDLIQLLLYAGKYSRLFYFLPLLSSLLVD